MHLDEWRLLLPMTKTRGLIDSSYFYTPEGMPPPFTIQAC